MLVGQKRPVTVAQACEALDNWLMGRDRVNQQICMLGQTNSNSTHTLICKQKGS
jgi:hypothetical protein